MSRKVRMQSAVAVMVVLAAGAAQADVAAFWRFDNDGKTPGTQILTGDTHVDETGNHNGSAIGSESVNDQWIAATINGVGTLATGHQGMRFDVANSSTLPTADSNQSFTFETFFRTTANFAGNIFEHRDQAAGGPARSCCLRGNPCSFGYRLPTAAR